MWRQIVTLQFECAMTPEFATPLLGDIKFIQYTEEQIQERKKTELREEGENVLDQMYSNTDVIRKEHLPSPDIQDYKFDDLPTETAIQLGVSGFVNTQFPYVTIAGYRREFNKEEEKPVGMKSDTMVTFEFFSDVDPTHVQVQQMAMGNNPTYPKRAHIYTVIWDSHLINNNFRFNVVRESNPILYDLGTEKAVFPHYFQEGDVWVTEV